jgi:hypothetical protein
MFSMFALWLIVFILVLRKSKFVPGLSIVTLIWTLVLLRLHMTSDLGLSL